ncbi:Testis-specific Y-encoded protein 1 [Labeo rohita]|uniref:Testis-specific Y-encoded protein 1 n=1 Tax=Labeo rohita TaxID=84645 RepID=A0ABQ8ME03_LABRO|nr:Testis-specific Y-encoded protein 1 [Labeo rohita]
MSYKDVVRSLALKHGYVISERHLKHILKFNGLCRRKFAGLNEVLEFIIDQLNGPGRLHGYRWMHQKCLENNSYDTIWNLYKRVHRRIFSTNYLAQGIIAGYFVESVLQTGGCPRIVRCDLGTENVIMRDIQVFFRRNDGDERAVPRSCITGLSSANQRIESWWVQMRKEGIEFWIQFFGELKDEGLFSGDFLDKALMQLCFRNIIQVSQMVLVYNGKYCINWHIYIRQSP